MCYIKVVVTFYGDKPKDLEKFKAQLLEDEGLIITVPDVRDKPSENKLEKPGMMTQGGDLKDEYKDEITLLFANINSFFQN